MQQNRYNQQCIINSTRRLVGTRYQLPIVVDHTLFFNTPPMVTSQLIEFFQKSSLNSMNSLNSSNCCIYVIIYRYLKMILIP